MALKHLTTSIATKNTKEDDKQDTNIHIVEALEQKANKFFSAIIALADEAAGKMYGDLIGPFHICLLSGN
eukprot:15302677-Ditylum_brightwellii.AAC.1